MGKLEKLRDDFRKALPRLKEAVERAEREKKASDYAFFRDSAIQRFEFTFEIAWKFVKALLEREGIICRSPRTCFKELFSAGFIDEETARELLKMVEDRNLTVDTYREKVAEEIFNRLPGYLKALEKLVEL